MKAINRTELTKITKELKKLWDDNDIQDDLVTGLECDYSGSGCAEFNFYVTHHPLYQIDNHTVGCDWEQDYQDTYYFCNDDEYDDDLNSVLMGLAVHHIQHNQLIQDYKEWQQGRTYPHIMSQYYQFVLSPFGYYTEDEIYEAVIKFKDINVHTKKWEILMLYYLEKCRIKKEYEKNISLNI